MFDTLVQCCQCKRYEPIQRPFGHPPEPPDYWLAVHYHGIRRDNSTPLFCSWHCLSLYARERDEREIRKAGEENDE